MKAFMYVFLSYTPVNDIDTYKMMYDRREAIDWQEAFYRVGLSIGLSKVEFLEVKLLCANAFSGIGFGENRFDLGF